MENNLAYTTNKKKSENNFCWFEPLVINFLAEI